MSGEPVHCLAALLADIIISGQNEWLAPIFGMVAGTATTASRLSAILLL
jgi:ABC-type uncharacterized transport system permease subunit